MIWKFRSIVFLFFVCGLIFVLNILNFSGVNLGFAKDYFPKVNLGLDLVGGMHFTLRPDFEKYVVDKYRKISLEIEKQNFADVLNSNEKGIFLTNTKPELDKHIKTIDQSLEYNHTNKMVFFTSSYLEQLQSDLTQQSLHIVRNRVDGIGTREINLYRGGFETIILQIPNMTDEGSVRSLLGKTAKLDFYMTMPYNYIVADKNIKIDKSKYQILEYKRENENDKTLYYIVEKHPVLSGEDLSDARVSFDSIRPSIAIAFNSKGATDFAKITSTNIGRAMAIVIDDKIICAPNINEPILGGRAVINGHFSPEEMKELAISLKSGALPAKIEILEQRNIDSSLGKDAIKSSFIAVCIGLFAVLIFMGFYYKKMGLVAIFGLLMNLFLTVTLFAIFDITLTMPGIAGLLLSLGMAVDVNVLIYEKMREFDVHRTPKLALIENGFAGAMSSIVDGNVTTLLASIMLLIFGTVFVKGFAIAITIGIVFSFFTAVFVTRIVAEYIAKRYASSKNFV